MEMVKPNPRLAMVMKRTRSWLVLLQTIWSLRLSARYLTTNALMVVRLIFPEINLNSLLNRHYQLHVSCSSTWNLDMGYIRKYHTQICIDDHYDYRDFLLYDILYYYLFFISHCSIYIHVNTAIRIGTTTNKLHWLFRFVVKLWPEHVNIRDNRRFWTATKVFKQTLLMLSPLWCSFRKITFCS